MMATTGLINDPPFISQSLVHDSSRGCQSEPIHIPGSIQPHGLLLLFDAESGALIHRAGDCDRLLGLKAADRPSAKDLLGISISDLIVSCRGNVSHGPVYIGLLESRDPQPMAMVAHRTGRFVAVELVQAEPQRSVALALDMAGAISQRINVSENLVDACSIAVEQVRSIVGFDSVMAYRFLDDQSGSVIAESQADHAKAYLGHRFPASDIPAQARDLYRRSLIRAIPDVNYQPAALEPAPEGPPLDMSHCMLRSVSPVHIQYMKNMGLGASMSISLLVEGKLWGLIVCHHYEPRFVPVETQLLCRHIGTSLSAFVHSFQQADDLRLGRLQTSALESLLESLSSSADPERRLRTSCGELAQLIECGGFVLLDEGDLVTGVGDYPEVEQLRELSSFIKAELDKSRSYATDNLGEKFGGAAELAMKASGLLAIQLEAWRPLIAIWLRPEKIQEIAWAGAPHTVTEVIDSSKPLTPRKSFATWREIVSGRSRPWARREIEAVELLQTRISYAMQRHRLAKLNADLGEANALLATQATTDPLTGLPNRRLFDERLNTEWERALRQKSKIALIAIDIDLFKPYNDHFGHPAGDECLKVVASAIAGACRSIDVAARLGGEEFAVLLPGIDTKGAACVAERLRAVVQELCIDHPHNEGGVVTISLGVAAASPAQIEGASELLSAADEALYQAKANGRNGVAVSD